MPSMTITINGKQTIRTNVPQDSTRGIHVTWVRSDDPSDEGLILFHVGGVDSSSEHVTYEVPDLDYGDRIVITIDSNSTVETECERKPYEHLKRS